MLSNLKAMQAEPVSASEPTRAKTELLHQLPMQRADVRPTALQYLRIFQLSVPLDAANRAAEAYVR